MRLQSRGLFTLSLHAGYQKAVNTHIHPGGLEPGLGHLSTADHRKHQWFCSVGSNQWGDKGWTYQVGDWYHPNPASSAGKKVKRRSTYQTRKQSVTTFFYTFFVQVSDLTLDEGSSMPLTSDIIKVASHHFSGMNFLYQVINPPRHGHLEHSRIPGMPITAFTHTEVWPNPLKNQVWLHT